MANSHDHVLQLPSIDDVEDTENSQTIILRCTLWSIRDSGCHGCWAQIQLKKDYATGNATFKQGERDSY